MGAVSAAIVEGGVQVTIVESFDRPLFGIKGAKRYDMLRALRDFPNTHTVYPFGELLHYTDSRRDRQLPDVQRDVIRFLGEHGMDGVSIEPIEPTIEDSFMARMGVPDAPRGEAG